MNKGIPASFSNVFISSSIFISVCTFVILLSCIVNSATAVSLESDPQINETLHWDAPYNIKKNFPYFLSGFDNDGSPVWVCEFGNWKIRSFLEKATKEEAADLQKYSFQFMYRMHQSTFKYSTKENPIIDYVTIGDLKGYELRDFASLSSLNFLLNMVREFIRISSLDELRMKKGIAINANYIGATMFQFMQPILPNELKNRVYLFGTNAEKWKIQLLREIPKSQLPDWLGGVNNNHKAVEVHG